MLRPGPPHAVVATALVAALSAGAAVVPGRAAADTQLVVRGAGFGHGVGMSQWGARGMAARGADAARILGHYYRGTRVGRLTRSPAVRVALQWGRRETTISGASSIGGVRVDPRRSYRLRRTGPGIVAWTTGEKPRRVARAAGAVRVSGGGLLRVAGRAADGVVDGAFRGVLDVLPDGAGVLVVEELGLEEYLRGVVTGESPASWPAAALQAQAIAARTYAITTSIGGRPFTQWPDTRSQVYRGVSGESGPGDAAVRATAGQVVTRDGRPVTTYYFAASGGRTEDVEHVFGGAPRPWLRSVADPAEGDAPLHRWTRRFDVAAADRRIARIAPVGSLRRIEVVRTGSSPRIVRARVVGDRGRRDVTGEQLQRAFSLPDRWATFTLTSISGCLRPRPAAPRAGTALRRPLAAADPAGGALQLLQRGASDLAVGLDRRARAQRIVRERCRLVGGAAGAGTAERAARLQRQDGSGWRTVRRVRTDRAGRFDLLVPRGGRWRVVVGVAATPEARVER